MYSLTSPFRLIYFLSMEGLLNHIEIEPDAKANACVIMLHGLGADGSDFEPVIDEIQLPGNLKVRYILPHAPERPLTMNNGAEERAWYDFIPHSEYSGNDDVIDSATEIQKFIDSEISKGIPANRIVLAGFSQGGVVALHTGLRYEQRIAGIVGLSTYLHDVASVEEERTDENLAIPIMLAHGAYDGLVPIMRAATARENLTRLGYDVRWFDYPMEHQVCMEEVGEITQFLAEILA